MARRQTQAEFGFTHWGGARRGAGRKPRDPFRVADHDARPRLSKRTPAHVTLRLAPGLPNLRTRTHHSEVLRAIVASSTSHFRVVHYAVLSNHLHLICEAVDERDLSRGIQGLCVRLARRLNRQWRREGTVFDGRYHVHVLETPREVRHALTYVLENARKHGVTFIGTLDPFSSARWFADWKVRPPEDPCRPNPLPRPRSWILGQGWKRSGSRLPELDSAEFARISASPTQPSRRAGPRRS
jgi:REP element-mobilizing transposase RayT